MRMPSRFRICGCAVERSRPPPMTAQHAQTPELPRQDQTRSRQAELADAGQPHAVGNIRFPALLDVLRMQQVDADAGIFQRRKFPVDAGRFHRGGSHAVQPRHEIAHSALQGAESLGIAALRWTQSHRRGDLHLVNVQTRRARVDDMHLVGRRLRVRVGRVGGCGGPASHAPAWVRIILLYVHGAGPGTVRGSKPSARNSLSSGNQGSPQKSRPHTRIRQQSSPIGQDAAPAKPPVTCYGLHATGRAGTDHESLSAAVRSAPRGQIRKGRTDGPRKAVPQTRRVCFSI